MTYDRYQKRLSWGFSIDHGMPLEVRRAATCATDLWDVLIRGVVEANGVKTDLGEGS